MHTKSKKDYHTKGHSRNFLQLRCGDSRISALNNAELSRNLELFHSDWL